MEVRLDQWFQVCSKAQKAGPREGKRKAKWMGHRDLHFLLCSPLHQSTSPLTSLISILKNTVLEGVHG